jgi:hypothetical protein
MGILDFVRSKPKEPSLRERAESFIDRHGGDDFLRGVARNIDPYMDLSPEYRGLTRTAQEMVGGDLCGTYGGVLEDVMRNRMISIGILREVA